jgi:hypothetical protein
MKQTARVVMMQKLQIWHCRRNIMSSVQANAMHIAHKNTWKHKSDCVKLQNAEINVTMECGVLMS